MKYNRYWINYPLLKNVLKNNILPTKISLLLFGGFLLMGILNEGALQVAFGIFLISAFLLTTIYAGVVQGYLTSKTDSTYMRSLPISTVSLWLTQYIAGFLLIIVPLCLEIFCLVIVGSTRYLVFNNVFPQIFIAAWILVFIYYSISFFVVCITGKRIGQFLFSLAFFFVPAGLYFGVLSVGAMLSIGRVTTYRSDIFYIFLPVLSGIEYVFREGGQHWEYLFMHLCTGTLFFIGSYFAYKYRPLEKTDEIILFNTMNYVIRLVIIIVCAMGVFCIFAYGTNLSYTYSGKEFTLYIALYIVIAIVIAMSLELVFNNRHIYRTLGIYIPIICFSIFTCYQVGNYNYHEMINQIKTKDIVSIEIVRYTGGTESLSYMNIDIDVKTIDKMITYLEEHEEYLYTQVSENKTIVRLTVEGYQKEFSDYCDIDYFVEESCFKEMLEKDNHAILNEIMKNKLRNEEELIKSHSYWMLGNIDDRVDENTELVIIPCSTLENIGQVIKDTYVYEDIFDGYEKYDLYWAQTRFTMTNLNEDIYKSLLENPTYRENALLAIQAAEAIKNTFVAIPTISELRSSIEWVGEDLVSDYKIALSEENVIWGLENFQQERMEFIVSVDLIDSDEMLFSQSITVVVENKDGNWKIQKVIEWEEVTYD